MPVVSYFIALLPCSISTYVGWNISFADLAVPSSKPVDDGTDIFLLARWQMKFLLMNTLSKIELFALLFVLFTLENHYTRKLQSSRGGCSQRVQNLDILFCFPRY